MALRDGCAVAVCRYGCRVDLLIAVNETSHRAGSSERLLAIAMLASSIAITLLGTTYVSAQEFRMSAAQRELYEKKRNPRVKSQSGARFQMRSTGFRPNSESDFPE